MKISWLNNVQAPYREPMLRELAKLVDFDAFYFFREEKVRHWQWRDDPDYRSAVVPAWRLPVPGKVARRLGDDVGILRPGVAADILRGTDALITQVWWQPAHLEAMVRCRRRGVPYVIFAESTMDSRSMGGGLADRLRSWVFRNAGAVVVPGPAAAEAAAVNGTPAQRIVETVNTIDVELFGAGVRALRTRNDTGGDHRFAYIGQLIGRKNVHSLIRAFAGVPGRPTLDIAGDGLDMESLRELAVHLEVADRVRFLGFLEERDVVALLARSQTLVLPSTEEVYGFTALEGHVAGLQVIVSDRAGIAANLTGRPGTWVVHPDVADLGVALKEAREVWAGWAHVDAEFASPRRAAADIVAAVELARGHVEHDTTSRRS